MGITKKTWAGAYMKLDEGDPAIDSFRQLGEDVIPNELVNGQLPHVKGLEQIVCRVYSSTGPTTIPELRWELFRSKYLEGDMLPPTRAALMPPSDMRKLHCHARQVLHCPPFPQLNTMADM